jgi:hypothetical protein
MQFDEEAEEFGEDFLSDKDPSILHFLLASGDEVRALLPALLSCTLPVSPCSAQNLSPAPPWCRSRASSCGTTS